ncbi:hypothetical protein CBR_g36567 [Chara braunii]|uniref:DUF7869 domain-containing protein n=1 Tax=Chara braunii TaxID=69332 RepID=A0A388JZ66_CHABU|nr:hypothetical protein CBR_g36567 [Chara braunii]|eukprot:GBG63082.1 hypothetical protein CBR_g36567 [Chara braunii]
MSENFVVKETLYDSVAQELRDNDTEEEEPSDDDDEEGESSDDDDEEEETSEDADSEDTDSEDDEGKNESGIDIDMFKKSLYGELLGEAKQIIAQEVRRGLYSKSSKSEKPPYKLGKCGRNARVYNKKANYHVNIKSVELVLKEDCCKANCYKKFTAVDVFYKREEFWAMKQLEQLNFFLAEMRIASYFSDEGDLEVLRVTFNGVKACTKVWGKLVFSKVKLNFLLVGHTHEDIDQMFSCFSRKLVAHADVSRAGEEVPPTANGFDQRWDHLFPPERPINIGARKSKQFQEDRDEKYDDLEVNTFIALRVCSGQEERGKPYHIGKVVELLAGKRFKVAWFAQREKGEGYYPQFKTNPQGKTTREPSEDVYDWSCGVLCYNFQLKTDMTLFSQTRQKISEMLNSMATEDVH